VLFVDGIESTKTLRVSSRAGTIHPAHCTSAGKALLAPLPRAALLQLFPDEELPQVTARSITSRTHLFVELESTATRGYAISFGELEDDIGSIAVPVRDPSGSTVAAIGVGAPASRLSEDLLHRFATAARSAAEQLGAELTAPTTVRQAARNRPPADRLSDPVSPATPVHEAARDNGENARAKTSKR
jgi:DNA-binding IclR family transcriptional regulator